MKHTFGWLLTEPYRVPAAPPVLPPNGLVRPLSPLSSNHYRSLAASSTTPILSSRYMPLGPFLLAAGGPNNYHTSNSSYLVPSSFTGARPPLYFRHPAPQGPSDKQKFYPGCPGLQTYRGSILGVCKHWPRISSPPCHDAISPYTGNVLRILVKLMYSRRFRLSALLHVGGAYIIPV